MAGHNDFGRLGESLACELLELKGYQILQKNFRYKRSEIDILALKGSTLAVVEVKSRSSSSHGLPEQFVDASKIRHLKYAVDFFLESGGLNCEVRFDIISVLKNKETVKVHHFPDAFYHF